MAPFGYELEFCGANLVELSCVMQIPLKPKGKYKNYDTFHLEPEEKITTADLNGGIFISTFTTNLTTWIVGRYLMKCLPTPFTFVLYCL